MARSFGDVMRDIGRALGMDGGRGAPGSQGGDARREGVSPQRSGGDRDRGGRDRDRPATPVVPVAPVTPVAPPVAPVTPEVPQPPAPVNPSDMTSTGPVEAAAINSVQGGRASTILTSPMGLLPEEEQEGLLRDRRRLGRSMIGGGLIQ